MLSKVNSVYNSPANKQQPGFGFMIVNKGGLPHHQILTKAINKIKIEQTMAPKADNHILDIKTTWGTLGNKFRPIIEFRLFKPDQYTPVNNTTPLRISRDSVLKAPEFMIRNALKQFEAMTAQK